MLIQIIQVVLLFNFKFGTAQDRWITLTQVKEIESICLGKKELSFLLLTLRLLFRAITIYLVINILVNIIIII